MYKNFVKLIGGLSLTLIPLSVFAQSYKEGLLYEVTGPVKELKVTTKNPYMLKHVKFQQNGKCNNSVNYFNETGYPLGWSVYKGKTGMTQKITYDGQNRVDSILVDTSFADNRIVVYTYDSQEVTAVEYFVTPKDPKSDKRVIKCEYSNYIYDGNNNWISRDVNQTTWYEPNPTSVNTTSYTEKRKINYYNN